MSRAKKWIISVFCVIALAGIGRISAALNPPPQSALEKLLTPEQAAEVRKTVEERILSPAGKARMAEEMRLSRERTDAALQRIVDSEERLRLARERTDRAFGR